MGGHAVECARCNEEGEMDDETDLEQNITGVERQGRRVPGASEVHNTQTALKEGLEAPRSFEGERKGAVNDQTQNRPRS